MMSFALSPLRFVWSLITGLAFLGGLFATILAGTACACAILFGVAMAVMERDPVFLIVAAVGAICGALWTAILERIADCF